MERSAHQCPCDACRTGAGPEAEHHRRLNLVLSRVDEQQRRWIAAVEAGRRGSGGIKEVAAITGLHPETIRRGRDERADGLADRPTHRIRLPGGGRPVQKRSGPRPRPVETRRTRHGRQPRHG